MKHKKLISGIIAILVVIGLILAATVGNHGTSQKSDHSKTTVRVGSKDFTESLILSEIYSQALEDKGYKVDRKFNISSSVVHKSLTSKEIDLYPEYTGTALLSILKDKLMTDPEKVYQTVKSQYQKKYGLTWLDYAQATDGQGLVIRTDVAKKLGIKTISDLQKQASSLRFASQGEFDQREDGLAGLTKAYGKFNWQSSAVYDNSLKYSILENDKADVAPAYTTEGQLADKSKFTLLKDDKNFWPPYNVAPVINQKFLKQNPDIAKILNKVSAKLTTDKLTKMNAQVDVDGKDYKEVAKEFYQSIR